MLILNVDIGSVDPIHMDTSPAVMYSVYIETMMFAARIVASDCGWARQRLTSRIGISAFSPRAAGILPAACESVIHTINDDDA